MTFYPRISILTPSYNQGQYIEQNIISVLNQNYPNFEHIIIDGGSSDNTLAILKKYPHLVWVSKKDDGQSDALNKGLKMATGEIVGWINSDDYYEPDIFNHVASNFIEKHADWIIGNLTFIYHDINLEVKRVSDKISYRRLIENPDIVRQQPTFFKKDAIESAGGWDSQLHMVMDYDLWVRLSKRSEPIMIDRYYAYFRFHGSQKTSYKNMMRQISEIRAIMTRENTSIWFILRSVTKKTWFLFKGYVKTIFLSVGLLNKKYSHRPVRLKI